MRDQKEKFKGVRCIVKSPYTLQCYCQTGTNTYCNKSNKKKYMKKYFKNSDLPTLLSRKKAKTCIGLIGH